MRPQADLNPLWLPSPRNQPNVLEDKSRMRLNLIQNRLNLELNVWSPCSRFLCCSNHRLTLTLETSFFSAALFRRSPVRAFFVPFPGSRHAPAEDLPTDSAIEPFFLFCAVQLYWAKLFRKGVVHSWIYSRIRHPQYLSLAIAGFGLLTIWPRIVILIFYLGMVFIYYFLARFEEKQVEAVHPEYAEYRQRTAAFIPGNPGGKLFHVLFGWMTDRRAALALSSLLVVTLVMSSGLILRHYTIAHAATKLLPEVRTFAVAVWPMPPEKIQQAVSISLHDERVRAALEKESGAVLAAHVLPQNYGMVNMFADVGTDHRMFSRLSPHRFAYLLGFVFPFLDKHRREMIMGSPNENYKVIFSRLDEPGRPVLDLINAVDLSAKMTPVVIADVRTDFAGGDPALQSVVIPPRRSFWGDVTMPMF